MKKQFSRESVHSTANSGVSAPGQPPPASVTEERDDEATLISTQAADSLMSQPGLIHRNSSISSSMGEWKLGRIQLTLRYSVARQRLVIVVHRIA